MRHGQLIVVRFLTDVQYLEPVEQQLLDEILEREARMGILARCIRA